MEKLSQPVETIAVPVAIPVRAYLYDHLVSGRVVLPAVEALQILALTLPAAAGSDPSRQERGVFSHLLTVEAGLKEIPAIHELSKYADGRCCSRLLTVLSGRQAQWTRRVENASVIFLPEGEEESAGEGMGPEAGERAAPPGPLFTLSRRRLYEELVPFGPAYQNVAGDVSLTPAGAWAELSGGDAPAAAGPLGSPFPADAAFHVACAWGQRYRNTIAFPVGFEQRRIFAPTRTGQTYSCRVVPLSGEAPVLRFDIWLWGGDGEPVEVIRGLEMRDISGGRRRPPAWVREGEGEGA
jgi:hypothetical protein